MKLNGSVITVDQLNRDWSVIIVGQLKQRENTQPETCFIKFSLITKAEKAAPEWQVKQSKGLLCTHFNTFIISVFSFLPPLMILYAGAPK